ncbi:MAG: tRNA (adenosine(37)-N6)-dimethylallyltransferase MiaA [Opitutales bacterium]|nr:tRNA (adenosine(37)-N6)-dimethylallyltransferase MiaA [Opitutales bacterium]
MINVPETAEILILTGTTAVGKTELSLEWAAANNAEILSCDSTTVYRGMDIGTAKPTAEERARVPHWGLDLVEPAETFSVGDYVEYAKKCVADLRSRGKRVLVSGGSGFYLKAFFAPVTDGVAVDAVLRERVRALEQSGEALDFLKRLNPGGAENFDWQNPRRVSRALERCLATGKTIDELRADMAARQSEFVAYRRYCVLLSREREDLSRRIEIRVERMLAEGLVEEVKKLCSCGLHSGVPAAMAIGYRETLDWLSAGEPGGLVALRDAIVLATRQLAAKQRKWFRSQIVPDQIVDL